MNIKKIINWKVYFIFLTASILSIIAIIPYILSLQWDLLNEIPLPLPIILILSIIQNTVIFSIVIFLWLFLSKKIWLWTKYLEEYLVNKNITLEIKNMFKKWLNYKN